MAEIGILFNIENADEFPDVSSLLKSKNTMIHINKQLESETSSNHRYHTTLNRSHNSLEQKERLIEQSEPNHPLNEVAPLNESVSINNSIPSNTSCKSSRYKNETSQLKVEFIDLTSSENLTSSIHHPTEIIDLTRNSPEASQIDESDNHHHQEDFDFAENGTHRIQSARHYKSDTRSPLLNFVQSLAFGNQIDDLYDSGSQPLNKNNPTRGRTTTLKSSKDLTNKNISNSDDPIIVLDTAEIRTRPSTSPTVVDLTERETNVKRNDELAEFQCRICLDKVDQPAATDCGHVFCYTCLIYAVQSQKKCPLCRKHLIIKNIRRLYL